MHPELGKCPANLPNLGKVVLREDVAIRQRKGFLMIIRRSFIAAASATLVCAPAVVRAASLMPVRGIVAPTDRCYFVVDRLYIHTHLRMIIPLQQAGLSAHEVAAEMNRLKRTAINDDAWEARDVIGVLKCNEQIQRADAILRSERDPRAYRAY